VEYFRDALHRDSDDFQTLTYLARVLASDPGPQIRSGTEALALAGQANDLTGGTQPFVLDALAMAQAEMGNFEQAQDTEKKALDIADGQTNLTTGLNAHLTAFQARQPWRENPAANAPFILK
jgi:hypothetical protein